MYPYCHWKFSRLQSSMKPVVRLVLLLKIQKNSKNSQTWYGTADAAFLALTLIHAFRNEVHIHEH